MDLKQEICSYLWHLEDFDYVRSILKGVTSDELNKTIVELLRSGDAEAIRHGSLFTQDLVLSASEDLKKWFRAGLYESEVISALQDNLFADHHFIRENSVYTLGKICSRKSAMALRKAFDQYKESDPLILPDLIFEIEWLEKARDWKLLDAMIECSGFTSRWAAVSMLEPTYGQVGTSYFEEIKSRLLKTKEDSSAFVRVEAKFQYKRILFCEETKDAAKAVKTQRRKLLKKEEPKITFEQVKNLFYRRFDSNDYRIAELEKFIRNRSIIDICKIIEGCARLCRGGQNHGTSESGLRGAQSALDGVGIEVERQRAKPGGILPRARVEWQYV